MNFIKKFIIGQRGVKNKDFKSEDYQKISIESFYNYDNFLIKL